MEAVFGEFKSVRVNKSYIFQRAHSACHRTRRDCYAAHPGGGGFRGFWAEIRHHHLTIQIRSCVKMPIGQTLRKFTHRRRKTHTQSTQNWCGRVTRWLSWPTIRASKGAWVTVTRYWKTGNVAYTKILALQRLNLSGYRGEGFRAGAGEGGGNCGCSRVHSLLRMMNLCVETSNS